VQKQTTDIVLTLETAAIAQYRVHPNFRTAVLRCDVYAKRGVRPDDALHCPPARTGAESDAAYRTRLAAYNRDWEAMIASDETTAKPVPLRDLKINVDVRSFESVIYYLGEIVRA